MKGLLDDAYELAVKLRGTLEDAEGLADDGAYPPRVVTSVGELAAQADDLGNQIDRQRTALRGS